MIDHTDGIIAYKYGVTSKNNSTRIKQVQNKSIYRLENKLFISVEDAQLLMSLESDFSKTFGKKYLTKAEMDDGYTETVSAENFETYVFWVNDYLSSKTIKTL